MMLPWQKRPLALNSPRDLPGLALWLDSKDVSSLRNDAGAQPVTTDGIKLASDKSGNSSTNVLCLNGVAGNYASAPDSVATSIVGDIDIRAQVQITTLAVGAIVAKWTSTGNNRSYAFLVNSSSGDLRLNTDPIGDGVSTKSYISSANISAGTQWVRVTLDVDNGAAGSTATFYTSPDGVTWTILGAAQTIAGVTSIFNSTAVVEVGTREVGTQVPFSGLIYRAQIYNGIAGTLAFDANFALAAKLATSFTESSSNAATVTINTSGATGARISGARDLYQGTAANQPILTIAAAGNYLTFDGSNDYLKAAAFALAQPETVYFVGSQVTWTSGDAFFDGNALGNGMAVAQNSLTPALSLFAGTQISDLIAPALNARSVISAVFSGAASFLRLNRAAAASASVGVESGNGFTLGCVRNTTGFANITAQEVLVYSGAHDKATQERVIAMLARNNRIALT